MNPLYPHPHFPSLRKFRLYNQFRQERLAAELGCSQGHYSAVEGRMEIVSDEFRWLFNRAFPNNCVDTQGRVWGQAPLDFRLFGLKGLRIYFGFSQEDMAKFLLMGKNAYKELEKGRKAPGEQLLDHLATLGWSYYFGEIRRK